MTVWRRAVACRADVLWLTECRRRLRRLCWLRDAVWLTEEEVPLVLHALWYVQRDFVELGLSAEALALIRSHATGIAECVDAGQEGAP